MIVQDQFVSCCWRCLTCRLNCECLGGSGEQCVTFWGARISPVCWWGELWSVWTVPVEAGRQSGCRSSGEARLVSDPSGQSPWGCQGCIPPFVSLSPRLSGNSGEQEFWQLQNPLSCESHGGDRAGELTAAMTPWVSSHGDKESTLPFQELGMKQVPLTFLQVQPLVWCS